MSNEIWKDAVGYEGEYQVSDLGRVRSLTRVLSCGRKLTGRVRQLFPKTPQGYFIVVMCSATRNTKYVHRLVAETFIGPCPEGMEVCHGPNGKQDNSVSNLRYGTHSENQQDRFRDGTSRNIPVVSGDNTSFVGAKEAGLKSGCNPSHITACCKGKRKTAGGHTWRYKNES